jgi:type I restriction enzyme S subunit
VRGVTFKPTDLVDSDAPDSVACLRTKNVQSVLDDTDLLYIPRRLVRRDEQFVGEGDTIVSVANSWHLIGKASRAHNLTQAVVVGAFIGILRPKDARLDAYFLYRWFTSPDVQERVRRLSRQTTNIANLDVQRMLKMVLDVPPLHEQRRIAAILDQVDELRAKRRRTLALLDELRVEVLISDGKRKQVPLAEHLAFLTSGSRGWARYYSNEGTPFLRIQNVGKDKVSTADLVRVSAPSSAEANRTRVQVGDVLLSITADLGRSAVVTPDLAGANVSQHLALLRLKGIAPRYVSAYLSSNSGLRQLMKMNRGATKQGLNFDDIRSILIPQLAEAEQAQVVRQLEGIDESASRADAHLATLDELFAALQHRAFTGQL